MKELIPPPLRLRYSNFSMPTLSGRPTSKYIISVASALTFLLVGWQLLPPYSRRMDTSSFVSGGSYKDVFTILGDHDAHQNPAQVVATSTFGDVQNRTLGFERVFVLAMANRSDKKDVWALASHFTGFDFEYMDGVDGATIPAKAVPAGWDSKETAPTLGCFRGHLNIMQKMVKENIQTALIFEDDADWDVTFKSQLMEVARGSRWMEDADEQSRSIRSPYGDNWDILWIGNCGVRNRVETGSAHYFWQDDPTVAPVKKRMRALSHDRLPIIQSEELKGQFSRLLIPISAGLCAPAYAMSLQGAEKFLLEHSVLPHATTFDEALNATCSHDLHGAVCYAVHPTLVSPYHPIGDSGKDSDRRELAGKWNAVGWTENIVFPVKTRLTELVEGEPLYSQWPKDTMWPVLQPDNFTLPSGAGFYTDKDGKIIV